MPEQPIVICGGGIIGVSTAYYLKMLDPSVSVTLIEKVSVASQASGKAGGFLARNWNAHDECLDKLTQFSFDLHRDLRVELGADVGYRDMTAYSVNVGKQGDPTCYPETPLNWMCAQRPAEVIGTPAETGQVHPKLLTSALFDVASAKGTNLIIGNVDKIEFKDEESSGAAVSGVQIDGKILPASMVVIALGPWTAGVSSWFPRAQQHFKFYTERVHSVVFDAVLPPEAAFINGSIPMAGGESAPVDVEIYPRPDGTVYSCGYGDSTPLPPNPSNVRPNLASCNQLSSMVRKLAPHALKNAALTHRQACYLPFSQDTKPVIGPIPGHQGAYIASGHGVWGILNAPATGLCLASILLGHPSPVDIGPFDMSRFSEKNILLQK